MRTDAGEDDEMIVDSKKLYNRFLDMVDKKQINIIHQSQAKKDQVGISTSQNNTNIRNSTNNPIEE